MHLFFSRNINSSNILLDEEETHHCNHVLRLGKGDEVGVLDGKGNLYECKIEEITRKNNRLSILKILFSEPASYHVHIALAPPKNMDRIEWFVEKATELSIHEISFLRCAHSERSNVNIDRLYKKAISALKQSRNRYLPVINPMRDFESFLMTLSQEEQRFIGQVTEPAPAGLSAMVHPGGNYLLLIGPEGDFRENEIKLAADYGCLPVSLGNFRLRTETAALAGLIYFIVLNQKAL